MTSRGTSKRAYRTRGRDIVFSPVDEAVFAVALRREFPGTVFTDRDKWAEPHVRLYETPLDCEDRRQLHIFAPLEPWQPKLVPISFLPGWHGLLNPPERELTFLLSYWDWGPAHIQAKWAWEPPTLSEGWIWGGFWPEEKAQVAFIRRAWRIIERIATNRYKKGHPLGNALMGDERRLMADGRSGDAWVGHHALEWSRAGGPRRMLDGCIRPCDDWEPPQDEWYRSLRAEVEACYGPALAEPPPARTERIDGWRPWQGDGNA